MKALHLLTLLVIFNWISAEIFAQPKKNLEIIRELSGNNIDSLFWRAYPFLGDTLNLRFIPSADSWVVENSIITKLQEKSRIHIISDTLNFYYPTLQFAISEMNVRYGKVFYDGFLGQKKVTRLVNLELSLKITNQCGIKKIECLRQQYQDTVAYDSIHLLENDNVSSTKCALPDEMFIDRILSPVIISSSVAVIVYLFFTLRK